MFMLINVMLIETMYIMLNDSIVNLGIRKLLLSKRR